MQLFSRKGVKMGGSRRLTHIEARVLSLRAVGLSLKGVAYVLGWKGNKERVRQVEAKALRKLREKGF